MVKLDRSKITENRPKDKLMLDTLNEMKLAAKVSSTLELLPEPKAHIMCVKDTWPTNRDLNFIATFIHLNLRSRIVRLPEQCDRKVMLMFKGQLMIVRPVSAVCYEIKSEESQKKLVKSFADIIVHTMTIA
ncbi:hypothetical protein AVEN_121401-1 [Araneus ventricosus]|uniref:Uncharacterized protein n=1 Tax=Araneus ventricosus TaxID=182803 RepID=A0A4Y2CRS0_ARAVE|nr:hypothetical protein AVEN_121401-1 [Araneus ventricosus]